MEFSQIAILLVAAGVFGIIAKVLKQPLIVGYLFAGLLLGFTGIVSDIEVFSGMGQIGVALLLFLLGLEMNLSELPTIGRVALITGLGQILFTSSIGFLIAQLLGFDLLPSVYIAIAMTFSSTIIMVKLLSEKKDLDSLYGKISVGFLLVQDFVAVVILMFLAGLEKTNLGFSDYGVIGIKAIALFGLVWFLSKKVLPLFFNRFIATSSELLFIVSIAWALGVAGLVAGPLGFTLEIGGFLAGIALSNLGEHLQIAAKTRPLRDFFLTIFFIILGSQLVVAGGIAPIIFPALIFSLFVLIGNPLIVLFILGILGYRRRTSFMAGLTVAQISEFSLIILAMGLTLGHVAESEVALVVMVGVITMTTSTYAIINADRIYSLVKNYLSIFERKKPKEAVYIENINFKDHVVLVGGDRTGKILVAFFLRKNLDFVVVDFNPSIYRRLSAEKTPTVFGDINDSEIIEAANLDRARMVISTISNFTDNLTLLEHIRTLRKKPTSIFTALTRREAIKLYESGATYVIVPTIVAGDYIRHIFEIPGIGAKRLFKMGRSHFNRLVLQ
jgi:Kef-type K+ transport system membrane component KefB